MSAPSQSAASPSDGSIKRRRKTRQLDQVDQLILAALNEDARRSNRELGRVLGVTEGTVRRRLQRVRKENRIRVIAVRNWRSAGFKHIASVGISVKERDATDVANDLAKLPQVLTASVTLGTNEIEIQVIGRNMPEITDLLTNVLPHVPGVARLNAGLALTVFKHQPQWAPLS